MTLDEFGVRGRMGEKGSRNANSIQNRFLDKIILQIDDAKGEGWRKERASATGRTAGYRKASRGLYTSNPTNRKKAFLKQ